MASNSVIGQFLETDVWVKATWEEFLAFSEDSAWEKGKFYYYEEQIRVEMSPNEYWVERANAREVFAFGINSGGSGRIQQSRVLPGLEIAVVQEALHRSQSQNDGEINRWLIQTFSQG